MSSYLWALTFVILLFTGGVLTVFKDTRLERGAACDVDGEVSTCKLLGECQSGIDAIKAGNPPPICSFTGTTPVICCPTTTITITTTTTHRPLSSSLTTVAKPGQISSFGQHNADRFPTGQQSHPSKSNNKCKEYAKYVFETEASVLLVVDAEPEVKDTCARIEEPLIVGGVNAQPREFPHMAQIGYGEQNPEWLCGGSLISERFVISAAHCSNPIRRGPARWARLGDLDTSTDFEDAAPMIMKIVSRYDYPRYDSVTLYNDLSLFKLEEGVPLSANIRPICLSTNSDTPWTSAIATGWGHTYWGGKGSEHLKKVRLKLVSNQLCNSTYATSIGKQIPQGIRPDSMICAGDQEGKDTCQGDSGGPLQVPIENPYCMYELIGVTSFGKSCGNSFPGVYTRVSHFSKWIEDIVWSDDN